MNGSIFFHCSGGWRESFFSLFWKFWDAIIKKTHLIGRVAILDEIFSSDVFTPNSWTRMSSKPHTHPFHAHVFFHIRYSYVITSRITRAEWKWDDKFNCNKHANITLGQGTFFQCTFSIIHGQCAIQISAVVFPSHKHTHLPNTIQFRNKYLDKD